MKKLNKPQQLNAHKELKHKPPRLTIGKINHLNWTHRELKQMKHHKCNSRKDGHILRFTRRNFACRTPSHVVFALFALETFLRISWKSSSTWTCLVPSITRNTYLKYNPNNSNNDPPAPGIRYRRHINTSLLFSPQSFAAETTFLHTQLI